MDKDRVEGSAHQVKGSIKEAVGNATGDAKLQSEGQIEKTAGKIQNAVGGIKDDVKEAVSGKR
jgi:uncharacterized protein YjbJ (UPF0337 family)